MQYRPDFGKTPMAASFDPKLKIKRKAALEDPNNHTAKIFNAQGELINYDLLLCRVHNILALHNMLRGEKEPSQLIRSDFEFGVMDDGAYEGCPCLKLKSNHSGQKQQDTTITNHTKKLVRKEISSVGFT